MDKPAVYWEGEDLILRVRIQPRASKDEIVGLQGEQVKIRITAPPVEGKANAHLIKFLAKSFALPRARIHLLSGETSRDKRLRIERPEKIPSVLKSLEV